MHNFSESTGKRGVFFDTGTHISNINVKKTPNSLPLHGPVTGNLKFAKSKLKKYC